MPTTEQSPATHASQAGACAEQPRPAGLEDLRLHVSIDIGYARTRHQLQAVC